MTVSNGIVVHRQDAFELLDKFSLFSSDDQRRWWNQTGPKLLKLLRDAQYQENDQFTYLYLLQQRIVPTLGVFPTPGQDDRRYWSQVTTYGVPYELSWNLLHNIVRIGFEPVSHLTQTGGDTFNQRATEECLSQLASLEKTFDLERFKHFQRELAVTPDEESRILQDKSPLPRAGRGQYALAVELQNSGINAKAYFFPHMKALATGHSPGKLFFDSMEKLGLSGLKEPVQHLRDFLALGEDGIPADSTVTPVLLGCDLCDSEKSRVKLYITDQTVTWDRVAGLWTLGGHRQDDPQCGEGLILLRKLWDLLEIPEGVRDNVWPKLAFGEPPSHEYRATMMANWTLSPNKRFPDPQIYFLTFGISDSVVMDALVAFYEIIGWTDLAKTYKDKVISY
ncbi:dimethylallyl tryptophan synthase [Penicillium sp. DV-2018c]|nr:dimethylallyl tryptophan synthase [Penicillium sp. DV-2018c]KAJ5575525.1 dimethylallyl tryptophan synthase [Penicillium sp. DV-2018c]